MPLDIGVWRNHRATQISIPLTALSMPQSLFQSGEMLQSLQSKADVSTTTYTYGALYRLIGADYSDGTYFRYIYDAYFAEGKSGNRLSEETVTGTITYTILPTA